jgi:polyribonucleotide nucleotidyltransferase
MFGASISLMPGRDGLLHVSQIRTLRVGARIETLDDIMKVGDKIQVRSAR